MRLRFPLLSLLASLLLVFQVPVVANARPTTFSPADSLIGIDGPIVIETVDGADPDDPDVRATVAAVADQVTASSAARAAAREAAVPDVPGTALAVGAGIQSSFAPAGSQFDPDIALFSLTVPNDVRTVVNAAIDQWDNALTTSLPVVVEVHWVCFGNPQILGFAGATNYYSGPGLPTGYWYPIALTNNLVGQDLNGASPEVFLVLNADLAAGGCSFALDDWYISTSTGIGASQVDLYSVVLHELGHGLGFLGSAEFDPVFGPRLATPPYVYDSFVYAGSTRLLSLSNPGAALTSNNLFFDLGGGHRWRLYAPFSFQAGSSFAHFDTSVVGQAGELMTPALGNNEIRRNLDAPVLGVMDRQGWSVNPRAVTPTITSVGATDSTASVTWVHGMQQHGLPPLAYQVTASTGGGIAASTTVAGAATGATLNGLQPSTPYTLSVSPLDRRGTGAAAAASVHTLVGPPRLIRSDGVGLTRTVTWLPSAGSDSSTQYTAQYRVVGTATWTTIGSTGATSIATPPLPPGRYQFRVRGSDVHGTGAWGLSTIIGVSATVVRPFPLDGQVARLYQAYLLRAPDPSGFDYWMGQRAAGRSLASISAAFASSPEFTTRYGALSNGAFVGLVYQNVIGRAPDAGGFTFWSNYLNEGHSRGAMMIGFSESAEYIAQTGTVSPTSSAEGKIYRLYLAFFQREPDSGGLAYWVGRLQGGMSLDAIANNFVGSAEFAALYGSTSNTGFVQLVYNNVLIRNPDSAGLSYWTSQLAAGRSRGRVMVGFSESVEFILRTGSLP